MKSPGDASQKVDGDQCLKAAQIPDVNILVCALINYVHHHHHHNYKTKLHYIG